MSNEDGSDSIFRLEYSSVGAFTIGSTLPQRAYAAIHLRVPDSGLPWLDAMIERARRDEFAKGALPALDLNESFERVAGFAYEIADAMLAQGRKG